MKLLLQTLMVGILLTLFQSEKVHAQCASNMGFENGNFGSWTTSTDSNFVPPGTRVYSKPGKNQVVVSYGSTDFWLGTITKPSPTCGNRLIKVGNRQVKTTADTVYRTYIVDSLSDKLTIYSIGVSETAHDYWNQAVVQAPGFGYMIYINGTRIDCLKGAFFCGNMDAPPVWNVGSFKDTSNGTDDVRKSVGWGKEELNFACFVGDTIEIRLFTRDCILAGHYAYAFFDIVCSDTTKPVITKLMVNDILANDSMDLYCTDSAKLFLQPNTNVCPIFRNNISWSPSSFVFGATNVDSAIFKGLDSMWIYAEATFSNFCQTINVRDSVYIKIHTSDPHDYIPKLPRNFCDCAKDTLDFGNNAVTSITDQQGNSMTLTNGKLIIAPCDKFYQETLWKNPSSKIVTNKSQIGTVGWASGNVEGAIGVDSILATGKVRFIIDQTATKRFYAGITTTSINNGNDMDHAIYFNGGAISAYYRGSLRASLGVYTGAVEVEFRTLANRRVEIWINGVRVHTYTSTQRANFPVYPDFAAVSNDTALIRSTHVYGPTVNNKDFTRLLVTTPYEYYLVFDDRCGITVYDTFKIIPGFESGITPDFLNICGLDPINITASATGTSIIDDIVATSDGDGTVDVSGSTITYTPDYADHANNPIPVYIRSISGRCFNEDTALLTFYENPAADAGPDLSSPPATYNVGGSPAAFCSTCSSISQLWNPGNAMNDSTLENPLVTHSLVNMNFFALQVIDSTTGCFGLDTAFILTPLAVHDISFSTNCMNDKIEFKCTAVPSIENYSFGVEYSTDNGSNWISIGHVYADLNILNSEPKEFIIQGDKITDQAAIYRWYSYNITGDQKSIIPIYDIDCQSKNSYTVFPNPFSDAISLNMQSSSPSRATLIISLYNEYGQKMYEKAIKTDREHANNQFYLEGTSSLANGFYFMNITSNDKVLYKTKILKLD